MRINPKPCSGRSHMRRKNTGKKGNRSMNILVCVKHVPKEEDLKLDRETKTLIRTNGTGEINSLDRYALELALRLKEQLGGTITAISMGPPNSMASLRYALSVGADDAVLLSDRALGGADAYATAFTLAAAVRKLEAEKGNFDLVLCGKNSSDGDTFLVTPALAEDLGRPHTTGVVDFRLEEKCLWVRRELDSGFEELELDFPAVLSVSKAVFPFRFPNVRLRLAANRREIPVFTAADLAVDPACVGTRGSLTSVGSSYVPEHDSNCVKFGGAPEEAVKELFAAVGSMI